VSDAYGASRICCTIRNALGFRVTLKCRTLRRSWPMTKKQYRTPNVSVGTVKKSIAAMASRWFLRNVSGRFRGSGFLGILPEPVQLDMEGKQLPLAEFIETMSSVRAIHYQVRLQNIIKTDPTVTCLRCWMTSHPQVGSGCPFHASPLQQDHLRHRASPGIIGLAQVSSYSVPFVRLDLLMSRHHQSAISIHRDRFTCRIVLEHLQNSVADPLSCRGCDRFFILPAPVDTEMGAIPVTDQRFGPNKTPMIVTSTVGSWGADRIFRSAPLLVLDGFLTTAV
jgi:hypothetical protein